MNIPHKRDAKAESRARLDISNKLFTYDAKTVIVGKHLYKIPKIEQEHSVGFGETISVFLCLIIASFLIGYFLIPYAIAETMTTNNMDSAVDEAASMINNTDAFENNIIIRVDDEDMKDTEKFNIELKQKIDSQIWCGPVRTFSSRLCECTGNVKLVILDVSYRNTKEEYDKYMDAIGDLSENISRASDKLEKSRKSVKWRLNYLRETYEWLCDNVKYELDENDEKIYTGYGAMVNKKAVCQGYAVAFKDLMDIVGVPCEIVSGRQPNDNNGHAWNIVELDGKWYTIDASSGANTSKDMKYFMSSDQVPIPLIERDESFGIGSKFDKEHKMASEDLRLSMFDTHLRSESALAENVELLEDMTTAEYKTKNERR